ncbi:hypothetical protein HaLaN_13388, partial [Haematococcus lacustris]
RARAAAVAALKVWLARFVFFSSRQPAGTLRRAARHPQLEDCERACNDVAPGCFVEQMDSMEHADCASKRGTLLFSYAAPEQLKQARLEVVQERVRERLARAAAARIQADPLQGLETEALWQVTSCMFSRFCTSHLQHVKRPPPAVQDDTATLDVSPLPDSCVALPPSGLDQYQQLVVPPAVNKSGEARMMTAKLVNKGKVDTYRQGTRDPSQPETLAVPVAYDLKTMEQIEAAEIAAAAAAARSNRRSSSVSSRSSGAALLAAAASTRSPTRTSAARLSADKAAAEGGAAKAWVDPLLSSLKASVQVSAADPRVGAAAMGVAPSAAAAKSTNCWSMAEAGTQAACLPG